MLIQSERGGKGYEHLHVDPTDMDSVQASQRLRPAGLDEPPDHDYLQIVAEPRNGLGTEVSRGRCEVLSRDCCGIRCRAVDEHMSGSLAGWVSVAFACCVGARAGCYILYSEASSLYQMYSPPINGQCIKKP